MHAQNRIVPRASAGDNTPEFKINTAEKPESELWVYKAVGRGRSFQIDSSVARSPDIESI